MKFNLRVLSNFASKMSLGLGILLWSAWSFASSTCSGSSSGGSGSTTGDCSMPWDSPLKNLQADLTGTVATAVGVIAFFAAGVTLVMGGEEMNGIVKRVMYIVLGVALVVLGDKALSALGLVSSGALVH